jgi:hypothetical protein
MRGADNTLRALDTSKLESIVSHCSRIGCIEGIDLLRGFIFKTCRNANLCAEGAMLCLSLLIEVGMLGCEAGRHDVSRKIRPQPSPSPPLPTTSPVM